MEKEDEIYSNGSASASDLAGVPDRLRPTAMASDHLDVEAYASLYKDRTKIKRLMFIAERCGNEATELEALRMAYEEARKGENTQLYCEVAERIAGRLGEGYVMDTAWCDAVDKRAEQKREKLDNELNS